MLERGKRSDIYSLLFSQWKQGMEQTLRIEQWVSHPSELDMRKGCFKGTKTAGQGWHRETKPLPLARSTAAGGLQRGGWVGQMWEMGAVSCSVGINISIYDSSATSCAYGTSSHSFYHSICINNWRCFRDTPAPGWHSAVRNWVQHCMAVPPPELWDHESVLSLSR